MVPTGIAAGIFSALSFGAGDFAGAAVFLAGRSSGYVTGQSVFVDGGFSVH